MYTVTVPLTYSFRGGVQNRLPASASPPPATPLVSGQNSEVLSLCNYEGSVTRARWFANWFRLNSVLVSVEVYLPVKGRAPIKKDVPSASRGGNCLLVQHSAYNLHGPSAILPNLGVWFQLANTCTEEGVFQEG